MLIEWGWPGTLSVICWFFNDNPPSSKYFFSSGMKIGGTVQWTTLPWPMLWGYVARGRADFFCLFLSWQREDSSHGKSQAWSYVRLCCHILGYHALNPGACFALFWILLGIQAHKKTGKEHSAQMWQYLNTQNYTHKIPRINNRQHFIVEFPYW